MAKTVKFKGSDVCVAIMSYTWDDSRGVPHTFIRGTSLLRGNHEAVLENPQYWALNDTPPSEWESPWLAVQESIDTAEDAARREREKNRPPAVPADRQVQVVANFWHKGRYVGAGTVFDMDDPLVAEVAKEHKDWFVRPAQPLK